jgi:hypothetical protein
VNEAGIVEMKDVYFLLDAIRILEAGWLLTKVESMGLKLWFTNFLQWMEAIDIEHVRDNYGIHYDVQALSISAFLTNLTKKERIGNPTKLQTTMHEALVRMKSSIATDGSMPHELTRANCEHTQMYALQGWAILSRLGDSAVERSLWRPMPFTGATNLCHAAQYAVPYYRERNICDGNHNMEDELRWLPLLQESRTHCPALSNKNNTWNIWQDASIGPPSRTAYAMPSIFSPEYSIAPFWNLRLPSADREWPVSPAIESRISSMVSSPHSAETRRAAFQKAKNTKKRKQQTVTGADLAGIASAKM